MARHLSLYLLLLSPSLTFLKPFHSFFSGPSEEYRPVFRSLTRYHRPLHLQTHDRSIVDPGLPNTILNHSDFSENNPFTVPAGVKGLDRSLQHYLTFHVNPIGIITANFGNFKEIVVNRNSRLSRTGGVRRKSRRRSYTDFY